MKFTLSWLKDHLDTDASLDAIAERLTAIGLEVEHVDDGAAMRAFRVVRVLACEKHPDADKLKVLSVDAGAQVNGGRPVQVVTNAINAREGLLSILALPGARFPETGETIGEGRLRGVDSHGRMCGAAELGLAGAGEGIADLPADAPVGATVADYAGLGDPVIELNLTPNRPDATSIRGIARDLAASGLGTLKEVPIAPVAGRGACPVNVRLDFPAGRSLARGFALRLLRGVRNGPSPDWMQRRLKAVGLRPVNALVDVTNYIMFDRGRPLHAFDAGKVHGDIVVREAREGETVLALNGRTYTLKPGMCVIADDRGVDGIAGVMGGEESGSDEGTTDVLIESAVWEPLNIARTGRALGINTDARYRFERGVDPALTVPALDLATTMMIELCGGEPTEPVVAGGREAEPKRIAFPFTEVERLTGLPVEASEQIVLLRRLGFGVEIGEHEALVTPPSWRPDIDGKADLVEEVMRLVGVDAIAPRPLPAAETVGTRILTALQGRERAARRALAARGMLEAVNYSFVSARAAEAFGGGSQSLRLVNPISADLSDMRPSLLPGLIEAATRNAARGLGDGALFEVSSVYHSDEPNGQKRVAGGVRRGTAGLAGAGRAWNGDAAGVSVFDAKADALAALEAVGAPVANVIVEANASPWYHPGRSGRIKLGPKVVLAEFGEFHPKVLKALDAPGVLCGFEVFLTEIPEPKRRTTRTKPVLALSPFQPVRRDFAFVVDEEVEALKIVRAVEGADRKVVSDVRVFDVFRGASIGEGLKSVAIEATLRPSDATFSEEDLETISSRIVSAVAKATGATLRS